MKTPQNPPPERGFTRTDLCAVVVVVSLLAALCLPALAKMKPHSDRASCANNLRQLGVGWQSWAKENGNQPPWYVTPANGGTYGIGFPYVHFAIISNYLVSPIVAVCPIDTLKTAARDFSDDPIRGLRSTNLQNKAVGYAINAEMAMDEPRSMLAGDRYLQGEGVGTCPFVGNVAITRLRQSGRWTKEAHEGQTGNLLFCDGSTRTTDNKGLNRAILDNPVDGNASGCTIIP